jgi:hypothetical protein
VQGQPNIERRPAEVIPIGRARMGPRHAPGRGPSRRRRVESAGPEEDVKAVAAPPRAGQSDGESRFDD